MKPLWLILMAAMAACSQSENQAASSAAVVPAASAATTSSTPVALTTENRTFFKQEGCLAAGDKRCFNMDIQYLHTNHAWINEHLLADMRLLWLSAEELANNQTDSKQLATEYLAKKQQELKEWFSPDTETTLSQHYQQKLKEQRGKIVSVATETEEYEGGARGTFYTRYLNFDMQAKKRLQLSDIREPNTTPALVQKLTALYRQSEKFKDTGMTEAEITQFIEQDWAEDIQKTFANPNSFYFTQKGVVFSFSPNEIGPSIMGEIELLLPYTEAQGLLKTEWLNP